MPDRIAKFFGKHIDLSKIIAISDFNPVYDGTVTVDVQLRDAPLIIHVRNTPEGAQQEYDALLAAWKAITNA